MKFLLTYKLFEKTSLLNIGVPFPVMKSIQLNYAISDDAQWKATKSITTSLRKAKNTLIISTCEDKLFVIFSYNKEIYIETYSFAGDDFGHDQWQRVERIKTTMSNIKNYINKNCKSYELTSGDWLHEFSNIRKMKKEESNFDEITNNFKIDFAENFTKIVKRLFGKKANVITDIIINHLKNIKDNLTDEQIREILFLNVDRAKDADTLKTKQKSKDPYKLYNDIVKADSLTIFNEYLIRFEDEYSDKYQEYLNVPIMIDKFTRDKVMTSFMIYLWSNKLIDL